MVQYTTAQTLRKLLRRTLVKKSGPVPGPERVSEGQYTDEPLKTALIQNPIQYTS